MRAYVATRRILTQTGADDLGAVQLMVRADSGLEAQQQGAVMFAEMLGKAVRPDEVDVQEYQTLGFEPGESG